ncbi:uncharacterized protein LOC116121766 [Pistacia vera]|uniref:uncharacterized protein LOC116121766 n=1 Tax=Pistacia vera TaxID=55513 RepID=UPI00126302AD|nr:uncharacterized protein LOC116121766 [Pistacia vera]
MADIAMLVAEEYERRVKRIKMETKMASSSSPSSSYEVKMKMGSGSSFSSYVSDLARKIKSKVMNGEEIKMEPKSQFSLAASNGVFSA